MTNEQNPTGIPDLDVLLHGGIPRGAGIVLMGPPGSGKTILAQQLCFANATPDRRVLYFNTLSEPTAKTLRFLAKFAFFDASKLERCITFVDLGGILRQSGLEMASEMIMDQVKLVHPSIVVIDSFRLFDELAGSREELRKFTYEIAVNLMAWEATALILGEYSAADFETNPLFSIVDGVFALSQRDEFGERQRFFRAQKMRGSAHSRDEHAFSITDDGIQMFAPSVAIRREDRAVDHAARCKTGIEKLDLLLGLGIPVGSSLLISGVAGTGKTVLALEFLFRGAQAGEKGILFSFEETSERLRATARSLGWDIDGELAKGTLEIVFIPQPEIAIRRDIQLIGERIEALGARRVVIDSVSVFLSKIDDPRRSRDQLFHLGSIVHNAGAVGWFTTDVPYGSRQLSRLGVEETVVDGVILLSSNEEGLERQRYIEVYKLRNTDHLKGRHNMMIGRTGVAIYPRYDAISDEGPVPALESGERISIGVPGLDALIGGGLLPRSATLVSGSAGIGKTTLALQFALAGVEAGARTLYVSFEEGREQLLASADSLELPLRPALAGGRIEILYLARANIRTGQFLTILTDRLAATGATRVVLDAATHILVEGTKPDELRNVLFNLVARFKRLGVTSMITLEATALASGETATERALSPIADNLLMMRYAARSDRLEPTLTVVKTRGSDHDWETHPISIGLGGVSVGPRPGS
jgi:circadian clock protein KaiC